MAAVGLLAAVSLSCCWTCLCALLILRTFVASTMSSLFWSLSHVDMYLSVRPWVSRAGGTGYISVADKCNSSKGHSISNAYNCQVHMHCCIGGDAYSHCCH